MFQCNAVKLDRHRGLETDCVWESQSPGLL